jgi:hypothetical protein
MKPWFLIFVPIFFVACNYTIALVHTEGTASDVVDDVSTPTISVPITK